jgi:hypothetical protein
MFVPACSDGGSSSTVTTAGGADDVVFGSGELPDTIPAEFPLPAASSVGSTMVITSTGFTEVVIRVGAVQGVTAEFFGQNLAAAGFTIDSSGDSDGTWIIEFRHDEARGTIDITEPEQGISQVVVRYNVPDNNGL